LRSKTKSNIFQWSWLFPYYSLLWVPDILPKNFNLHNTHQTSNRQTLFLYSEKKSNWKKHNRSEISQRSEISLDTGTILPSINHIWLQAK